MTAELEEELERFFAQAMVAVMKFPVTSREELCEGIFFGFGRAIALADGIGMVEKYASLMRAGGQLGEALRDHADLAAAKPEIMLETIRAIRRMTKGN